MMYPKIASTISHWIPELVPDLSKYNLEEDLFINYILLRTLAQRCMQEFAALPTDEEPVHVSSIFKVINLLYQGGDRYTKNAIENEFLLVIGLDESALSFKNHLQFFPVALRHAYIHVILEN